MGDGILAYFGFPRAHEDDAARAVHAGLELVEIVAGLKTAAREKISARIGIATGLVVVGDIVGQGPAQEQAVVADTPNLAARLQGLADPGGIVISQATRRLVGDRFRLRDMGKHAVKGLAEPVEARAALGVSLSESRFEAAHAARLTSFVGREAEAADLLARQTKAWAGQGQIVLISGEAGIGKSRISAWLAEQTADSSRTRLRYQCSPYLRDSALYPFAQQFERAAGVTAQKSHEAKLEKLEKVLGLATERLGEVAPLIAAMMSIPTGTRYPPLDLMPCPSLSFRYTQVHGSHEAASAGFGPWSRPGPFRRSRFGAFRSAPATLSTAAPRNFSKPSSTAKFPSLPRPMWQPDRRPPSSTGRRMGFSLVFPLV
jgi:adenylate/guanylate cyclase family protein/AAA ATPase-like protein